MLDGDDFRLNPSLENGSQKKISPQDDARQRAIAKYGLDPKITPKEMEAFLDRTEREKAVSMCHKEDVDCPLSPSASWPEINAYHKERARVAWAVHNDVDPDLDEEKATDVISERGRLRAAEEAGLPLDTSWNAITLHSMRIEEERKARGGKSSGGEPSKE